MRIIDIYSIKTCSVLTERDDKSWDTIFPVYVLNCTQIAIFVATMEYDLNNVSENCYVEILKKANADEWDTNILNIFIDH
jgi:hypothetical protein